MYGFSQELKEKHGSPQDEVDYLLPLKTVKLKQKSLSSITDSSWPLSAVQKGLCG